MEINKCSILHIGNRNSRHIYNLQSALLTDATVATDLGIIVDYKLRFASHDASIVKNAY